MKYWENKGKFQKELNELTEQLIPPAGECATHGGEILRAAIRLYYDAFNNGFCNNTSGAINFLNLYLNKQFIDESALNHALNKIEPCTNTGGYSNVTDDIENSLDTILDYAVRFNLEFPELAQSKNINDMFDFQDDDFYEDDYEDEEYE